MVRASTSGVVGRGLRLTHTKRDKDGTGSFLADARNKKLVPGRYEKPAKYLLRTFVMSQ